MNQGLVLEFTKMHGAGNDFIVIDNRFYRFSASELSNIAASFCPRRTAIGADGLLALDVDLDEELDYRMRYFNADGSLGEMCGNGARCLAAFARASGLDGQPLSFSTESGRYRAYVDDSGGQNVRLILPMPTTVRQNHASIDTGRDGVLTLDFVMAGVPHAVCFHDRLDQIEVESAGSVIRRHESFQASNGTNVDFVQVGATGPETVLSLRTFERGVESETLACGTGAVSAFVAARERGLIQDDRARVEMKGGTLQVGLTENPGEVFLEGPATFAFRGTVVL